ncbi:DinB family protein [Kroppenstedtia pulmonis]|uniref:DinB family protein n=1 Tax=Kroppenstedtia pulmonis TaxID=1380685 RepID=A0A7D3XNW4_9BACL|nr:DinB family protein [Kroppenstedtia pulmonis]QKG83347.1 DinB family protein [Kroppenstedtia pulmonis]
MNEVNEVRRLLLEEAEMAVSTTERLLSKVKPEEWSYQPRENMMTLLQLARHLTQIPAVDLAILQEQSQEKIRQLEKKLSFHTAEDLASSMKKGYLELKEYMNSLDVETFLTEKTRPFYDKEGKSQAKWLTEIVTHLFHHRAQLFNYLKELGHPVTMSDLYATQ